MYGRIIPPFNQLLFASIVGLVSGVYIFQPWYFVNFNRIYHNDLKNGIEQQQLMDEEEIINYSVDASTDR